MPEWTIDQQKVIDEKGNNILVSAAAGSGKTAVLVERIINKIVNYNVEVDSLLVVTFTNAAAKEMKERIRKALDKEIVKNPKSEFLIRQNTLIANANISTIDSFCGRLVRDNYNDIGIDPSFRICDSSEESIFFNDAIDKVLENNFASEDNESFMKLINLYTSTSDYSVITDVIKNLSQKAYAYPWPKEWLNRIKEPYISCDNCSLNDISWIREMHEYYIREFSSIKEELLNYINSYSERFAFDKKGTNYVKTNIEKTVSDIDLMINTSNIEELYSLLSDIKKMGEGEKSVKKSFESDNESDAIEELWILYQSIARMYNDMLDKILKNKADDILEECKYVSEYALQFISLTEQTMDAFDEIKSDNNAYTFNDIERFALNVLINPDTKEMTDIAKEIRDTYTEVMIDEYQDSNDLQEKILSTLSNGSNMFMVGDVKQSIYGFRNANPDIFVDKCDTFTRENDKGILINLKKNFRSRREVLQVVNDVFDKVMTRDTCGIEYDDNAKLYFGAEEMYSDDKDSDVEILIADANYGRSDNSSDNYNEDDEDNSELYDSARQIEAAVVAQRIQELFDSGYKVAAKDKDDNVINRDLEYSDIAIILRSANSTGREYEEALLKNNIPCVSPNTKGYFDTVEVKVILSFLAIIDNPCKDIELAAILHSPIFNISNDMLAKINLFSKEINNSRTKDYLYYKILEYIEFYKDKEESSNDKEFIRLVNAINLIKELRIIANDTTIHEMLEMIYEKTSYLDYVTSLFNGKVKRANLLALIDKALDYEKTRFKGIFRFLKYIDSMGEYNLDLGEASISSENDNVVKIITMHKSKGLEFPVVFVCELGSKISNMDASNTILVHNKLGIGMQLRREINGDRYKKDTQYKNYIKKTMLIDNAGEEARLLYVAMTRAKEKLILTAALKNPYDTINNYSKGNINFNRMIKARNRMEWIIRGIASVDNECLSSMIEYVNPKDTMINDIAEFTYIEDKKAQFNNLLNSYPKELSDKIRERLSFVYPYAINDKIKSKYSVSEIKHNAIEEAFNEENKESIIPEFVGSNTKTEVNRGALYGTAMHRVLECYDFLSGDYKDSLKPQIDSMRNSNLISEEQLELISINKLQTFLDSDIANRMHNADLSDDLWVEQPFVLQEEAKNLFKDVSPELDPIIVQGIIDVFFIEDDEIVLLDYKTDNVKEPRELVLRYKAQIDLYAKALEKSFGKKVKEKILYSFSLEKAVNL